MDAIESAVGSNPASRQKSCNACVKSKRRCDKKHPVCSRCAEKKYTCVYQRRAESANYHSVMSLESGSIGGSPSPIPPATAAAAGPAYAGSVGMDFSFLDLLPADSEAGSVTGASSSAMGETDLTLDPYLDFIGSGAHTGGELDLALGGEGLHRSRAITPLEGALAGIVFSEREQALPDNFGPWRLYDSRAKVNHIVDLVSAFPASFAQENETPFLHRRLYKDYTPRCILHCFSTSTLYINKTDANRGMVIRSLQQNLGELHHEFSNNTIQFTSRDKLARVHALLLYQIIRLFDEDENLRSQAEADIRLLQSWVVDLCDIRQRLLDEQPTGGLLKGGQDPRDWEKWIFAESVCRTIVIAYSVISLYHIVKGAIKDEAVTAPWTHTHVWTLSRHLWDARSAYDFYRLWREQPHLVIKNFAFDDFLRFGSADNMDEFARFMLTVYLGVDQARDFLSRTGPAY